jgi:PAS domain S-box-containing protein
MPTPAATGPAGLDAERIESALRRERLHLYDANLWPAVSSQTVVVLLVIGAFWPSAGVAALASWAAMQALSLTLRIAVGLRLRRAEASQEPPTLRRLWASRLAVVAAGAAWGAAGLLLYAPADLQSQTLLAFVLAAVAAGSLSMTAFDLTAAFPFAAFTLLPLSLRMVGAGNGADTTMGVMALLFVALLGLTGRRGQRLLREMVIAREAERQRAESLLESQQRLQQLSDELRQQGEALTLTLDSMDQGILSMDEQGRTRFFNRRLTELLDMPEAFFAARPTMEDIARYQLEHGHYGEDFGLAEPKLRRHLESWFAGQRTPFPGTYLRRTPGGTMLEVKSRYLPGAGLVRTFSDVTAFFEARERLQHSQAEEGKLALVAAHTDDAVAITDAQQRIEWINAAFTRMTGHSLEHAAGRRITELLRGVGTDFDALQRLDEQLLREHKASAELRYQLKDGRTLWLALETHAVLGPDGAVQHYISLARDFTARHAAEEALRAARDDAERASRAKSDFLSAMSHELRTPMNAILGFAQLLASDTRRPLAEPQHTHVQQILQAGTHLLTLIDDVLDLARVEAGKQPIRLDAMALGPLVRQCLELVRPLAEQRRVTLAGGDALDAVGWVAADRTRLKQVLLNLLSNAIKYNREGGEVRLAGSRGPDEVWLDIADTGPGIGRAAQARLFTAFERLGAEAGPIPGAGIGLTLSRRMLELMAGRIEVASEVGVGSTFRIGLRRAEPSAPAPVTQTGAAAAATQSPAAPPTRRVLYIEDNAVNAMLVEAVLERVPGVRLVCAQLPQVGIDLALADPPDLILLDIQLPGFDGFEVLRRLRGQDATRAVPVVAVSANAMRSDLERARAAGFDDYLTKPIDLERLLALVGRCGPGLDRSQLPWGAG